MDAETFVSAVKTQASDSVASSLLESFKNPPGTSPAPKLLALSKWFLSLNPVDQEMVGKAVQQSAESAVFGFLCILDGARPFEQQPSQSRLELFYVNGSERFLLNDPKIDLHDLL